MRIIRATVAAVATILLAFGGLALAAPASAAAPFVGEFGTVEPFTPKGNGAAYWETRYAALDAACVKGSTYASVTDGGKTVTVKPLQDAAPGVGWVVLVVKGATSNNVVLNPVPGVAYASPATPGGPQSDVSHYILCSGTVPKTEPTIVTPALGFTLPDCDGDGSVTKSDDVDWEGVLNGDGTTTWTASPRAGTAFAAGFVPVWVVPDLSKLVEGCQLEEQPDPKVTSSDETEYFCESTTAKIITTTTTTPYVWDEEEQDWVLGTPVVTTADRTRDLEQSELSDCPLVPGGIESVCVGDVPYLSYAVALPEGFVAGSETPVTITFVNPDGADYIIANQPLSGELLWPGASDGTPKMWPGWALVGGEYVETEDNFAWTRDGVLVRFQVNPTYAETVEYPEATAACANPASTPDEPNDPEEPNDPADPDEPETLAVTGGVFQAGFLAAGAVALLAGVAMTIVSVRRRKVS